MKKNKSATSASIVAVILGLVGFGAGAQARYVESDPIGLAGGPNPYSYASQNPVQRTDFYGLVDVNLQQSNSPGYQLQQGYNTQAFFTVGAHGLGWGFTAKNPGASIVYSLMTQGQSYTQDYVNTSGQANISDSVSVADTGDRILASGWNTQYGPHKPLQLSICYSGSGGDSSFAEQLANYLARATNAPATVYATPDVFELQEVQGSHTATPTAATTSSLIPFSAGPSPHFQY
jgi:hypothetical protein